MTITITSVYTIIVILSMLLVNPIMLSNVYEIPGKILFLFPLFFMICKLLSVRYDKRDQIMLYFPIMTLIFVTLALLHEDVIVFDNAIQYLAVCCVVLFIIKYAGIEKFTDVMVIGMSFIVLVNIAFFILYLLDLVAFTNEFKIGERPVKTFMGLVNTPHEFHFMDRILYRTGGIFDEPGQFSFMLWHIVALNRLTVKRPQCEKILIYGGFLTMSLAHLVIYIFFILLVGHISKKRRSYVGRLVCSLFYLTAVVGVCSVSETVSTLTNKVYLSRINLEGNESGDFFVGDRFKYTHVSVSATMENPLIGIGIEKQTFGAANITDSFLRYGLVGGVFYLLPLFVLLAVSLRVSIKEFLAALCIVMLYVQRPSVSQLINMVVLTLMIYIYINSYGVYRSSGTSPKVVF